MNKQNELTLAQLEMVVGGGKKRTTKEEGCEPKVPTSSANIGGATWEKHEEIYENKQIFEQAMEEGRMGDAAIYKSDQVILYGLLGANDMAQGSEQDAMYLAQSCEDTAAFQKNTNDLSQYNFGRTITPERQIELDLYYAYEEGRLDDAVTICRDT